MDDMSSTLSLRAQGLSLSPTLALTALAKKLQTEGLDIISLAAGEPDLPPPMEILQGLQAIAMQPKSVGYTEISGLLALRTSIACWLKQERKLSYTAQQILVTPGCKMAIFQALFALVNPGDEVLFGAPYWVSYPQMTAACEGRAIMIPTNEHSRFMLSAEQLKPYLSSRSKVILLNNPHNPTGQTYTQSDLEALAAVFLQHPQLTIIMDDIYDSLVPHALPHLLHIAPELTNRTVVVNGLSKNFGLTGWRLGFAAGPQHLIAAMTAIQSQTTTCVAAPIQYAAIQAYEYADHAAFGFQRAEIYRMRAQAFMQALAPLKSLVCFPFQSGFYIWADWRKLMKEHGFCTDPEMAKHILEYAQVAVIPGSAFGMPGYCRLSVTTSTERLCAAAQRLVSAYHIP